MQREGTVRRGRLVACVCFLGIFLAALVTSLDYSLTDALGPGPGFFPFWLSLIGGVLALLLFARVTWAGAEAAPAARILPERPGAVRVARVLLGLAGVAALLTPLGFRLAILLFTAYLLAALGVRRWWLVALFALTGSFGVFQVFYHWLQVPLPIGPLGI
jgi:putative tricarboxylic transport membrane protein